MQFVQNTLMQFLTSFRKALI